MAIRANANRIVFYFYNEQREGAPTIPHFPDYGSGNSFAYCIWVKNIDTTTPDVIWDHAGKSGSQFVLAHNGSVWYFEARHNSVAQAQIGIAPVVSGSWSLFALVANGTNVKIYYGVEGPGLDGNPDTESYVVLQEVINIDLNYSFEFDHIAFVAGGQSAICNIKFWNTALTYNELIGQAHRWDANAPGGGALPYWACPLRTPGDLASIANPYASPVWNNGHAWTLIDNPGGLIFVSPDPAYLTKYQQCPTWLYPLSKNPIPLIKFQPGTTPAVPTVYKGLEFWDFEDRGSLPATSSLDFIAYYGYPFPTGSGVAATDSWGLYKNESGNEVDPGQVVGNRFENSTGVTVIPGINAANIYAWKFGAQFTFPDQVPAVPTAQANVSFLRIMVVYVGKPTGVPTLPVVDLAGLFAINKGGKSVDRYNRGVELKIPDPTIRTAFVGE